MANKKGNPQNFIPLNERSPEEARKFRAKAAKSRSKFRKRKEP